VYSHRIRGLIREKIWMFKLKYPHINGEWMFLFFAMIWVVMIPIWMLKSLFSLLKNKNILVKSIIIVIPFTLFGYLYTIIGEPNQEKWQREIFPKHIAQIPTKVYDVTDKMIGGVFNRKLEEVNKGTFYVESVPKLYWDILKHREEQYLDFNNNHTGVWGIIKNHRSFNGVDPVGVPINALFKQRGGSSLSQQLVKNFYGQDYFNGYSSFRRLNTLHRKIQELDEAKMFYHNLRDSNGEEFKRWILMYSPFLVSAGSVYGIESVSAVIFGKKPKNLSEYEQVLLSSMYKYTYYFQGKINKSKCKRVKNGAKSDVANFFKGKKSKIEELTKEIDNWSCPTKPRVPFAFYHGLQEEDAKGRAIIGNPNDRIWEWAGTSAITLQNELDSYREKYDNRLIIEAKMSVDVPKNIIFKDGVNSALAKVEEGIGKRLYVDLDGNNTEEKKQANIWISVVNEKGEIKYIYKRGETKSDRRVGSISKIFEAIALGNRGDRYDYYYCNEAYKGLKNSNGDRGGSCQDNHEMNIYSARQVFGQSKNLPMKSAFEKYVIKNTQEIKVIEESISDEELEQIYKSFNLKRDNNTPIKYELSFGLTNSSPLNLQKAIHKLTHLLYYHDRYREAHITKSIKYKIVKNSKLIKGGEDNAIYSENILKITKDMFDRGTKIYMQTLLKAPLDANYGTLRSFSDINGFSPLFMKSGTTDKPVNGETLTQSKWVSGAIKVKGESYSFVIMVHHENGLGKHIGHHEIIKPIFREIVKALGR
jgi:hypothetical protein